MDNRFPQPISKQIWLDKYRLVTPNPDITDDLTVDETWDRIASACAYAPRRFEVGSSINCIAQVDQTGDNIDFRSILEDFTFLPGGRITAGAGSGRNVTLFNCYVMGTVPDDISGIFDMLREAALTMQQGGGIGYDFSTLRPAGSPVKGVDADASGPLTFMDVWDAMCKTIMSAGYRRGAMMATIRCDHPDIEAFIIAKQDKTRLRMFNMSVLCTDKFMEAVKADEDWQLVHIKSPPFATEIVGQNGDGVALLLHKTIRARDLWKQIMDSTYNYAEPGVLFIDRINQMNNMWYCENIVATNPCGEQPLPPYGACLLGSINLTKMVEKPFIEPTIDWNKLRNTAKIATRMLDTVIDISCFPLQQQKEEAFNKRRMGIGITGLADLLFMMNITYGSPEAVELAGKIMKVITIACYEQSILQAKYFGPCPATLLNRNRAQFLESGFMANMPSHIKKGIMDHGIRNALLTSIAPTGTISMYAGNVSSGIEPIFAAEYSRKILENNGTHRIEVVKDYAVNLLDNMIKESKFSLSGIMNSLVTAQTLTPRDHLVMLEAIMPWVDSSISKTINCPRDISMMDFEEIYMVAHDMGLKGCTTYRPNDVTGSILSVESDEPEEAAIVTETVHMSLTEPMPRPDNLTGTTYKLKWDGKSYYVTINDYPDENGHTIPFEVFINSADMESLQWTVALTRMISAVFRRGGQVKFIGQELQRISDPSGGQWINKRFVSSFVALLGQTLDNHLTMLDRINELDLGYESVPYHGELPVPSQTLEEERKAHNDAIMATCPEPAAKEGYYPPLPQCPKCRVYAMVISDGCHTCQNCGHSKCG